MGSDVQRGDVRRDRVTGDCPAACPACLAALTADGEPDLFLCAQGHTYTSLALALATNRSTVAALWRAVRALEDDAAALTHLAQRPEYGSAEARLREASAAREAADRLRSHVAAAQQRLDALASEQHAAGPN